jgi:hypothetical protein
MRRNIMKDFWAKELQNRKKNRILKRIILAILVLLIIAIGIFIYEYYRNLDFRQWCDENILKKEIMQEDTKSIELDGDENTKVYSYEKYICVFRKKTLEFYNKMGTQSEKMELDINEAVFTTAGRYMAICENNGQKFYLICGKEKLFESEIEGNITQIKVSRNGYVALVISNTSYKSIVDVFDKDGREVFKTNLVSSRVADICMSQDSKMLAIAEVDLSGILIQSKIQVVSMELAQNRPNEAILYKYEAPTDKLIMNIEYQEQNKLVCMYNDGIECLQENKSTELAKFENRQLAFTTIELNNSIVFVEEVSTGEYTADTKVKIINSETSKETEYVTKNVAKSILTSNNKIAINFGTELHIIDKNGFLVKKYISDSEINNIVMTDALVGIVYKDKIQIINI